MTSLVARINQAIRLAGFDNEIQPLYKSDFAPKRISTYIKTGIKRGAPAKIPDHEHILIIERYKNGETLQDIGESYNLTRERIRQILKGYGITQVHGGRSTKSFLKCSSKSELNNKKREKAEIKCHKIYGCSLEFKKSMGEQSDLNSPITKYRTQKNNANTRGIEWNLTLKQWWDIWQESGKWEERGFGSGKYVMARMCDMGPYSADNVQIITHNDNSKDAREMDNVRGRYKLSIAKLARENNIKSGTLRARLELGWDMEEALTRRVTKTRRIYQAASQRMK